MATVEVTYEVTINYSDDEAPSFSGEEIAEQIVGAAIEEGIDIENITVVIQ